MSSNAATTAAVHEPISLATVADFGGASSAHVAGTRSSAKDSERALAPLKSAVNHVMHEVREIGMATCGPFVQCVWYGTTLWHRRSVIRAFSNARFALGQCMFAVGIDDGETGAQINALDQKMRRVETASGSTKVLQAERNRLVIQLADAALVEEAPLPGADAEYGKAREAQAALHH